MYANTPTNTLGLLAQGVDALGAGIPGSGLASTALQFLSGLGGSPTGYSAGKFSGFHSTNLAPLDDTRVKAPDAATYLRLAKEANVTVEDVAILIAYDCARNGGAAAQSVWDGFAAGNSVAQGLIPMFNAAHAGLAQVVPGSAASPFSSIPLRAVANYDGSAGFLFLSLQQSAATGTQTPGIIPQASPALSSSQFSAAGAVEQELPGTSSTGPVLMATAVQQSHPVTSSNLTGTQLGTIVHAGINGAIDGASAEFYKTDEGTRLVNKGAESFVQKNGLLIGGAAGLVGIAFTWALTRKK